MSPTERTLRWLRAEGYIAAVVEKWNPHARIRQDLFGFADILAMEYRQTHFIQCTAYASMSSRRKKMIAEPMVREVLARGGVVQLVGWKKVGNRWHPCVERLGCTPGGVVARRVLTPPRPKRQKRS